MSASSTASPVHVFDQAVALQRDADGGQVGHTHPAWWNMVGPFGGITAATVVAGMAQHPEVLGQPVALTVNYLAGFAPGPFRLLLRIVRTNRSSQHWLIECQQAQADGGVATVLTGTAVTALRRPTFNACDHPMPQVTPASQIARAQPPKELEWLGRYDTRMVCGAPPTRWDGAVRDVAPDQASLTRLWARLVPERALDCAALAALADVFYPRVWLRRAEQVPAGTVSMTVYFHADAHDLAATGDGFVLCQARAQAYRDGHADQTAQLWNEAGTLLATSHQLVYYKI
jgi:hypothetical protein